MRTSINFIKNAFRELISPQPKTFTPHSTYLVKDEPTGNPAAIRPILTPTLAPVIVA